MKRYSFLTSLLLIMTLIIGPVVNAFAIDSMPIQSGCGMDMSAAEHQSMMFPSSETSAHHTPQMMADMPCCDGPASTPCCDDECQCVTFSGSMLGVDTTNMMLAIRMNSTVISLQQAHLDIPLIIKPKRPPITLFS